MTEPTRLSAKEIDILRENASAYTTTETIRALLATIDALTTERDEARRYGDEADAELLNFALRVRRATTETRPLNESGPYLEWWQIGLQARGIIQRAAVRDKQEELSTDV